MTTMLDDDDVPVLPSDEWRDRIARAYDQTGEAEQALAITERDVLRFPYAELDELTGPVGTGGDVWFLVAPSGSGKTTTVCSMIEQWRQQGKRVFVMPLETSAKRFRANLACMELGFHPDPAQRLAIDPGDINSGHWITFPNHGQIRQRLLEVYRQQVKAPWVDQIMVENDGAMNVEAMARAFKRAFDFGADVIVVDHIDHIDGGKGNVADQSKRVCHLALNLAKANNLRVLFTSQINFDMIRNPNRLAKYGPPQIQHLKFPTTKVEVATGIIGLSRAIRPREATETEEEYRRAIKAAMDGEAEPHTVLDPGVTQVNALKLRNRGRNDGKRILLGYDHGRITSLRSYDHYQTGFGGRIEDTRR